MGIVTDTLQINGIKFTGQGLAHRDMSANDEPNSLLIFQHSQSVASAPYIFGKMFFSPLKTSKQRKDDLYTNGRDGVHR